MPDGDRLDKVKRITVEMTGKKRSENGRTFFSADVLCLIKPYAILKERSQNGDIFKTDISSIRP